MKYLLHPDELVDLSIAIGVPLCFLCYGYPAKIHMGQKIFACSACGASAFFGKAAADRAARIWTEERAMERIKRDKLKMQEMMNDPVMAYIYREQQENARKLQRDIDNARRANPNIAKGPVPKGWERGADGILRPISEIEKEMKKYEEDAKAYDERQRLKRIQTMQQRSRSKKRLRRSRLRRFKK